MSDILENEVMEEIPQRVNPFCVISKDAIEVEDINSKKHDLHMIETNSSWGRNPYGNEYAVVPDDMVQAILETKGFCDIVLNEDGTEVVSFTAREIPVIPEPEAEPTQEEKIAVLETQLAEQAEAQLLTDEVAVELYEAVMAQEEVNIGQDETLVEIFELIENL